MIYIQTIEPLELPEALPARLQQAAATCFRLAGGSSREPVEEQEAVDLTIVISDDAELQKLNREYMGVDAPTDVLSFPSRDIDPESGALYLGDIVLSYPQACRQAEQRGHTPDAELELLVVHGVLHLLDHDHATEEERQRMWALQDGILTALGSPILSPND